MLEDTNSLDAALICFAAQLINNFMLFQLEYYHEQLFMST